MDWLKQLPKKWLLLGSGASIVILITLLVGIYLMVNKEPRRHHNVGGDKSDHYGRVRHRCHKRKGRNNDLC